MTTIENQPHWDVAIIGGGAAGFFAAITLKTQRPQLNVTLIESTRSLLSKVRISGGGRCNVTHACWEAKALLSHYPRGHRKLQGSFQQFGPKSIVQWFEEHGVPLKTEEDGRVFPVSDSSESIARCLEQEAERLGIIIQSEKPVKSLIPMDTGYQFALGRSNTTLETQTAHSVILATGGAPSGYGLAEGLGHVMIPTVPSLFTFCVEDKALNQLSGISVPEVTGKLEFPGLKKRLEQTGPLLITHWGLSGPCILRLSAWGARELAEAKYKATLWVDWFPQVDTETLRQGLLAMKQVHDQKQLKNALLDESFPKLPHRLWDYLLEQSGFSLETQAGTVKDKTLNVFSEKLKRWPFPVNGKGPFKEEFVTAGGVPLTEIDLTSYESKKAPNVFIVGELLNIDGVTGGFNFQNAWTSGYLAGCAISTPSTTAPLSK